MDAQSLVRAPVLVRAPMLVREVLFAFVGEVEDYKHPLVKQFGFDLQTFQFVKEAMPTSLLMLSKSLVRAGAVRIQFDSLVMAKLISSVESKITLDDEDRAAMSYEKVFCHQQVMREILIFLADTINEAGNAVSELISVDPELHKFLMKADTQMIEMLCRAMSKVQCVKFYFDRNLVKDRTKAQMRHERREGIKDILVAKKATYSMMSFLFTEENEDSVKWRRTRLGVEPLKGRPKTAPLDDYVEFICMWTANADSTELERFLMAHRKLGYSFDVIWTLYQKAESEGDLEVKELKASNKTGISACRITTLN